MDPVIPSPSVSSTPFGYISLPCVGCDAALYVPIGHTVPLCPTCDRDQANALAWDEGFACVALPDNADAEIDTWLESHLQPLTHAEEDAMYAAYRRSASGRFMVEESSYRPGVFYVIDFAINQAVDEAETLHGAIAKRDELERVAAIADAGEAVAL